MLRGRRLALVVSTPPARGDLSRAAELAHTARARGVDVDLFVMSEAVAGLAARPALVEALVDAGCEVVACATSADELGVAEVGGGVLLGSQDDHAAIVHRADRVVAFT